MSFCYVLAALPVVVCAQAERVDMTKWDLLAELEIHEQTIEVRERHTLDGGVIGFFRDSGPPELIQKAVGDPREIRTPPLPSPQGFEDELLASQTDLLGEKVLAQEEDPSFEACAAFLADVSGYTFLSTEKTSEIICVETDGSMGTMKNEYGQKRLSEVWFNPAHHLPEHEITDAKRGILGSLPVVDYGFADCQQGLGWELIALAAPGDKADAPLEILAYLRVVGADGKANRTYFSATRDQTKKIEPALFFAALFKIKKHWDTGFSDAMEVDVPEPRVMAASTASLIRAFITYDGAAPRYGVGYYGRPEHETFPPTTISMVNACVEWGLLTRAGRYLDHYLDKVVKEDGTFDYYGPAISEYGQMLDVIARFARRTGDTQWLKNRRPKIEAMVGYLMALRSESQEKFPEDDVRHGLVFGSPEADTRKEVDYYYSGDAWTWRGWTEMGRVLRDMGDEAMKDRGEALLNECQTYRADVERSIQKSLIQRGDELFVPPIAGFDKPFKTMTQDRFASYTNYRYWIEMLSAGFLKPTWHDAVIAYRQTQGGELLGTTRFTDHLDDWPFAGYGYGLLLRDRVRPYLLGLYGDLSTHRMRDTFTAYEQVDIKGRETRSYRADYCVPAQLVTPLMVRWMLVFEEPDADVLWLCRATPRPWLAPGERIEVKNAATRWGLVSFSVLRKRDGSLSATIELPTSPFPAEIRLRLRRPGAPPIRSILVNGEPHDSVDSQTETVRIHNPKKRLLNLVIQP